MDYEIIWSEDAIEDINEIAEYIARDSINYAVAVATKIFQSPVKLQSNPLIGREVPEFTDANLRELFVYSYRVIYRIENYSIQIVAVIHGSRMLENTTQGRSIEQ